MITVVNSISDLKIQVKEISQYKIKNTKRQKSWGENEIWRVDMGGLTQEW